MVTAAAQTTGEKISYHKFPDNKVVRKAMVAKIERENFVLSRYSWVYSLHLKKGSFIRLPYVDPI